MKINQEKQYKRNMAYKLQVLENMVRSRLEYGGPLQAQEINDGVRLSHEEFLYLARIAMRTLNRDLNEGEV